MHCRFESTYHTIIPALATRPGPMGSAEPAGVMGVSCSRKHLQVVVALVDDELDPQAALDRPRFCIGDGESGGGVALEEGLPDQVVAGLAGIGHPVEVVGGWERALFGRGQIILRDTASGTLWGGSDPRADGCAMGL
jgi:gamma-glutamyltranspeptidase/glutathione hydrolase